MRSVRSGLWLFVFVLGAALPAFCQPIVPPNTSGFRIFSDTTKGTFEQNFYSTGPFKKAVDDGLIAIELGKKKPPEVVKEVHAELDRWLSTAKK